MDRLIIESILADANDISLSDDESNEVGGPLLVLGFSPPHAEQVVHAFNALKELIKDTAVDFVICETLVSGMYDLQIVTDALDEPIRIVNKVIGKELLAELETYVAKEIKFSLTTDASEIGESIKLHKVQLKNCVASE
ncbi:hypothetical protein LPB86_13825 [Pedobacter sp. MC2016-14]|uniref:hypothetical protein n=1 Tax=Pedobacter sp. MC2016-14 TaxID=2897327 RepID=UPI001E49AE2D|nr:hypothetical protein [Pedobacter sp. MC2016-14]MCD0489315.1 hypothetical protein [Pedobacter sp. MC2016-14]